MDDRLLELLSRSLDGDLDDEARLDLERRLECDPVLAAELGDLRRLRGVVAELAARMEPPAELDTVMDPLRRSAPPPPSRVRPLYRWLGAAAALILGVTVTFELARRSPEPVLQPSAPPHSTLQDDRDIFQLAPLPTASPDEDRPVGAADQLLKEQPVGPEAPPPAALEVVGPLSSFEPPPRSEKASDETDREAGDAPAPVRPVEVEMARPKKTGKAGALAVNEAAAPRSAAAASGDTERADAQSSAEPQADLTGRASFGDKAARTPIPGSLPATLVRDGVVLWEGRVTGCGVGTWRAVLEIRDAEVVRLEPVEDTDEACRAGGLEGTVVAGLADGRHEVEVTVRLDP